MVSKLHVAILVVVVAIAITWYSTRSQTPDLETPVLIPLVGGLKQPVNIAVVGSGVGGASAAYFVREYLGAKANIHVYEGTGECSIF